MLDIKSIQYPARVQSGNINSTAATRAVESAGFKQVAHLVDLYAISDFVLSDSGDNTDNDAIGQRWYVQEEQRDYQLVSWQNRKKVEGWQAQPISNDLQQGLNQEIEDRKNADDIIKNYTINSYKLSGSPIVLRGSDLEVSGGYNLTGVPDDPVNGTDKISMAIGKLEKKSDTLKSRIDNINSAYQFVASVDTINKVISYPKDANVQVRKGSVFNILSKFTVNGNVYEAGTNVAINDTFNAGATIPETSIDALGGSFDTSKLDERMDSLQNIIYTNHASAGISVNPSMIYRDENAQVSVSWWAKLAGLDDAKITYTVTKDDTPFATGDQKNSGSPKNDTITKSTHYTLTANVEGVNMTRDVWVNAYYPIYTFTSASDKVTEIPQGATKQPVSNTAAIRGVKYSLQQDEYFYIAYPDTMGDISSNFVGNSTLPGGLTKLDKIAVLNKGNYKVFRCNQPQAKSDIEIRFQ